VRIVWHRPEGSFRSAVTSRSAGRLRQGERVAQREEETRSCLGHGPSDKGNNVGTLQLRSEAVNLSWVRTMDRGFGVKLIVVEYPESALQREEPNSTFVAV
jgi:hypothetical protein